MATATDSRRWRAIWISDVHLGTRHAQVDALLAFLKENRSEYLYIVGDLIDGWELKRQLVLGGQLQHPDPEVPPQAAQAHPHHLHHRQSRRVPRSLHRAEVRWRHPGAGGDSPGRRWPAVPGNPRSPVRRADPLQPGARTTGLPALRLGPQPQHVPQPPAPAARDSATGRSPRFSSRRPRARSSTSPTTRPRWCSFATAHQVDGIICGHIHRAEIRDLGGMTYLNCGDWVESCTALVEDFEGNFSLIHFHENSVHGAGRGPGAHDPGARGAPELVPLGA